jgi:hypothetical protein
MPAKFTGSACSSSSDPVSGSGSMVCGPSASEGIQFPTEINEFFDRPGWGFFRHECLNKGGSNGTFAKKDIFISWGWL